MRGSGGGHRSRRPLRAIGHRGAGAGGHLARADHRARASAPAAVRARLPHAPRGAPRALARAASHEVRARGDEGPRHGGLRGLAHAERPGASHAHGPGRHGASPSHARRGRSNPAPRSSASTTASCRTRASSWASRARRATRASSCSGVAGLAAGAFAMAAGSTSRCDRSASSSSTRSASSATSLRNTRSRGPGARAHLRREGPAQARREQACEADRGDPDHALDTLAREELGLNPGELGSPTGAAASSFGAFAVGAATPLVPFALPRGAPRCRRRSR